MNNTSIESSQPLEQQNQTIDIAIQIVIFSFQLLVNQESGIVSEQSSEQLATMDKLSAAIAEVDRTYPDLTPQIRDLIVLHLISNFLTTQYTVTSELFAQLAEQVHNVKKLEKVVGSTANGGKCASSLEMIWANQQERIGLIDNPNPETEALIDFVPPDVIAMNQRLEQIVRQIADQVIQGVFQTADKNSLDTVFHNYHPEVVAVLSKLIKDKMINQEPPAEFVTEFRKIWDSMGLAKKRFIIRSSSRAEDGAFAFPGVGDSTVISLVEGWDEGERFDYSVRVAMSVFASLFNEAGLLARLTNVDLANMLNFNPANGEFMGALVQELAYPETADIRGKSDVEIAKEFVSYYCFGDKAGWTVLTALWGNGAAIADSKASQSVVRINNEVLNNLAGYTNFSEPTQLSDVKTVVYCESLDNPGEQIVFKEYTIPPQGKALILEEDELDSDLPISERWKRYVVLPEETQSPFLEIPGLEDELFYKLDVTRKVKGYQPDQEGVITVNRTAEGNVDEDQAIKRNKPVQSRPITGGNAEKVQTVGKFPEIPDQILEDVIRNSIPVQASFHPGISDISQIITALRVPENTSQSLILLANEISMEAAPLYKLAGVGSGIEVKITGPTTHGAVTFGEGDHPIISGANIISVLQFILGEERYTELMRLNGQIETEIESTQSLSWLFDVETKLNTLSELQLRQLELVKNALNDKTFVLCAYQGLPGVSKGSFAGSSGFIIEVNSETQSYVNQLLAYQAVQEENKFNLGGYLADHPLSKIRFGRNASEKANVEKSLRQGIYVNTLIRPNQLVTFTKYRDSLDFTDPKGSEIYNQFLDELTDELYELISPMKFSGYRVIAAAFEEIWCKNQKGITDLIEQFGDTKFSVMNGASFVKAFPQVMQQVEMVAIKRVAARMAEEDSGKPKSEQRKIDFIIEFPKNLQEANWFLQECVVNGLTDYPNIEIGLTLEGTRMVHDIQNLRIPVEVNNLAISIGSNDLEAMSNNVERSDAEGGKKDDSNQSGRLTVDSFPDVQRMFRDQSLLISDIDKASTNALSLQKKYRNEGREIDIRFDLCGGILSKAPLLLGHIVKAMNGLNGYLNFPTKSREAEIVARYATWLENNYSDETGYMLPEFVKLNLLQPEFAFALSQAGIF